MPVILLETPADFDLLAFEVYVQVNLKIQHTWGGGGVGGGGGEGSESPVFSRSVSMNYLIERAIN